MIVVGLIVCLLHTFTSSDAVFTWTRYDASVDFIQGQTAKLVWNVDIGTGKTWGKVVINRNQIKSDSGEKKVVEVRKSDGVITKYLSGRDADIDLVVQGTSNVVNVTFTLHNLVQTIDEMNYRVSLVDSPNLDTESRYTFLRVFVVPGTTVLQLQPDKSGFCRNDTINITCNGLYGHPPPKLTFLQNDSTIGMLNGTTSGNYTKAVLSHALTQPGTLKFSCNATNAAGSSPTSNVVTIIVKDPPVITNCKNKTVFEKENLVWTCDIRGSLSLNTSWFKGNTGTVFQSGKSLRIDAVNRNDSGMYIFTASIKGECPTASKTVYLDVQLKQYRVSGSCRFMNYTWVKDMGDIYSNVFKTHQAILGNVIEEGYKGYKYFKSVKVLSLYKRGSAVIVNFQLELTANVRDPLLPLKEALNKSGGALGGYSIDPNSIQQDKPRNVQVVPASVPALNISGSFSLTCKASSNPDGNYTWSLNGVPLVGKTNRLLTKDNIMPQDAGEYTCTVTNSEGSGISNKVTINVNYKPKMQQCVPVLYLSENASHVFNCEKPKGFPAPSYTALYNGNNYNASVTIVRVTKALNGSVIRCSASNSLGSDSCNTRLIVLFSEYVYKGSFRITNHLYQDILDDRSSLEFKILKAYIENMLKSVYTSYKYVTSAEVMEFWPGSVIVGFQLKLIAIINDPLSPMKEALIKNGSSLDGLKIDPTSIQSGEYVPPTTMRTTKATTFQPSTTPCLESFQVLAIVLGVLFAIALVFNIILVGYIIWKHRIENKARPKSSSNNNEEAIYMNNIAIQDEVPSNVAQNESVGNQEQHQPTTQLYQSLQTQSQTDTYSSLSPNTKLPPKPAVITNSGVYQDLQGASRPQYQSLDNFSRV